MNRLQKKCFIVSAGTHLLLALILLVGPAFLSSKDKIDNSPILDFIPVKTVDSMMSGGGNPNARPPAATPPAPAPPVHESKPAPTPPEKIQDPPKALEKQESDSLEVKRDHKSRLPQVSTALKTRHSTTSEKQPSKSENRDRDNREREMADARRRAAAAVIRAAANIGNDLSGGTSVELRGPGGGGVPYANFLQALKTLYTQAWNVPDGADDDATVSTSVTIARDGTVVSAHITRRSGNNVADSSVQLTLDRVRRAVPLPDDAKEDQRTVTITFSVKAKRLLG